MYVAVTAEHRVLAVDLRGQNGPKVYEYVKQGVNAPADFEWPDNLVLDHSGNLFIAEDPGGDFASGKRRGDDVWRAAPSADGVSRSPSVTRFLSLTDCDAEPTGIYLNSRSDMFFLDIQHRGGDGQDYSVVVTKPNASSARKSQS
jgi:secreted PhoX family phosphatase